MLISIYSHLFSSPSAEWLAPFLMARTMREGGENHLEQKERDVEGGGVPLGCYSSSPSSICIYIRNYIVQMEEISISTEGDNDISQLFVKKKKKRKKKEEENC